MRFAVRLDGAERAIVRSILKLAYETVNPAQLPAEFAELALRIRAAEDRRGAARIDPPGQEVAPLGDGRFALLFRPRLATEDDNAAMSLATNLAVADALQAHRTGLFRVMAEPDTRAVKRLRHTARAFGIDWPASMPLLGFERGLDAADPRHAAMMMAIRRASAGAKYVPYHDSNLPWHAAVAATYAHATAPLRRLADRYVVQTALAIANGQPVPDAVTAAFPKLSPVMASADAAGNAIERAVIELAEAVMLHGEKGRAFPAVVTDVDSRGARIQLCERPVVARVAAHNGKPGDQLTVRLTAVSPSQHSMSFQRIG